MTDLAKATHRLHHLGPRRVETGFLQVEGVKSEVGEARRGPRRTKYGSSRPKKRNLKIVKIVASIPVKNKKSVEKYSKIRNCL